MKKPAVPKNSVALVAGGGGGLGQALAAALREEGYRPVLLGRSLERLETARDALGGDLHCEPADITDRAAVERALENITMRMGPPLLLVNAAGAAASAPLLPPDDALWDRMFAVNAKGAWILSTACLPVMFEAQVGFIGHIASTAAGRGFKYTAAYVASKHALLGLTRALTADLEKTPVRVGTICPGFLDTPMTDRTLANLRAKTGLSAEDALAALTQMNTSRRLIRPAEVARGLMHLIRTPQSHGAELRMD